MKLCLLPQTGFVTPVQSKQASRRGSTSGEQSTQPFKSAGHSRERQLKDSLLQIPAATPHYSSHKPSARSTVFSRSELLVEKFRLLDQEEAEQPETAPLDLLQVTSAFKTAVDAHVRSFKKLEPVHLKNRLLSPAHFPSLSYRYLIMKMEKDFCFPGHFRFCCAGQPPLCYVAFDYPPTLDQHLVRHEAKEFRIHADPQTPNPKLIYVMCALKTSSISQVGLCFFRAEKKPELKLRRAKHSFAPSQLFDAPGLPRKGSLDPEEVEKLDLGLGRLAAKGTDGSRSAAIPAAAAPADREAQRDDRNLLQRVQARGREVRDGRESPAPRPGRGEEEAGLRREAEPEPRDDGVQAETADRARHHRGENPRPAHAHHGLLALDVAAGQVPPARAAAPQVPGSRC